MVITDTVRALGLTVRTQIKIRRTGAAMTVSEKV